MFIGVAIAIAVVGFAWFKVRRHRKAAAHDHA
jgi:hypothetical protein